MSHVIHTLVARDDGADRAVVEALLSDQDVAVVGYLDGLESGTDALPDTGADVVVVACGEYSQDAVAFIESAARKNPSRPVVLICGGWDNGWVGDVFDAGAADIVMVPRSCDVSLAGALSHQVSFSLQKAVARHRRPVASANESTGTMICVLGLKGGSGKTLTTGNLGVALADAGHRVVVVDVDLQFGDVGLALGLSPERTIYDLVKSGGALDAEKLEAFLVSHPSGLRALLAPVRPDQAGAVTVDFLREVYGLLRATNDFVLVDTPPSFTPEVIGAIDSSSDVCMVGMLDSLSLKNTKLGLETLELMGYDPERIRFVLNRSDTRVGITPEDVVSIVGREPDVHVPSDREVTRSVNEGEPIALSQRRSEAARAFHTLASLYTGQPMEEAKPRRRRGLIRAA